MAECSFCGRTDGTHADSCYGSWTRENTPPTYDQLAAWNNDLRMKVQALRRQLAKMQDTIASRTSDADALRGVLSACRETLGADDNAALYDACAEAADLRRQLAECQLAQTAIPVAALRRCFYTGYETDAQVEEDEIAIAAWLEVQP